MAKFSLIILFFVFLNASIIEDYKNKNYKKICNFKTFYKFRRNEKALAIIGDACVKTDNLYLLPYVIKYLKYSTIARKNAIYFLVIYSEKRLLYSFLFDNFDISLFSFPKTKYILSEVFEAIKNKNYKKFDNIYLIEKGDRKIKMYKKNKAMIIEEIFKNSLIKRHIFK